MELADQPPKLGGSLLVPSVKELAKEHLIQLPSRYIRTDVEDISFLSVANSVPQVPVIDLHKLFSSDLKVLELELQKLDHSCKECGFFQLINHGVSTALVENVKLGTQEFLNIPMEEKKKFWQTPDELEGFGQAFVVSEEQKLDWGDMFYMLTLPKHLRKPHLFPKLPLPLRETLETYSSEMKILSMKLLDLMTKALGMDPNDMRTLFEGGLQGMKMNYYPPCPEPEHAIGLTSHSDASGLTILLQINEVEGLQIRKDGVWVPVKPLPNAFVVNIGDVVEIVSNGIYRSIEHRVTVNKEKERLSFATYYSPKLDGDLGPAPSLVTPETPALFRRIGVEDYFKGFYSRQLRGKSYVDFYRVQNVENDSTSSIS